MDEISLQKNVLTDRLLRSWVKCRRKSWLDINGDKSQKTWVAHRALELDNQQKSLALLFLTEKPERGLEACARGAKNVVGLRLKGETPQGNPLEAHPPVLQRIEGSSKWGKFEYRPVLPRQGRRITREHRLVLAISGFLLGQIQSKDVKEGMAINLNRKELQRNKIILKSSLLNQLFESLEKLSLDINKPTPPPLTTDRRKCTLCSWRSFCNIEAAATGHLSEVSGVGSRRRQMLLELGISNLSELAETDPQELSLKLESFGNQHVKVASELVAQAKAQKAKKIERLSSSSSIPELVKAEGVLVYDIESDPDAREDFLHGFLEVHRNLNGDLDPEGATYHPLLLAKKQGKKIAWEKINSLIMRHPDWPILHYGDTELLAINSIAKHNHASKIELDLLHKRLVDIHKRVRRKWLLPLNSYTLKTVAAWLGFRWSKDGADGARALLWWRQWKNLSLIKREKSYILEWIFEYNKDDCLATWTVAEWLLEMDRHSNQKTIKYDNPKK
ncbi:TM0106 family RecB-like putative nuclease [Prochlorococcus sp. MIT 1300]|uniref:TM0106 family RecB-like putative nuclease n=1 Tax=Prochlorococcus sp. MIT 1300 TaxID=3096218 RepID=UPI002A751C2D|nr:TM0106 family RecB-like putative nuclease [Prochlorococcus sp. MIT 1300]